MSLIAALVAVPLIAAVLLMLFRSESQRNVITIAAAAITGVTAVAFAVQYLFVGHVSFALPQETSYIARSSCGMPCVTRTSSPSFSASYRPSA